MTATNHFITADRTAGTEISVGTMVRWFTRLVGLSLVMGALGMWVAPNATALPELMLMKLCASFFFALTGAHLLYSARTPRDDAGY